MRRIILIDEFQLGVFVPKSMPDAEVAAVRRTLNSGRFQGDLIRAVRKVLWRYRALRQVEITLAR